MTVPDPVATTIAAKLVSSLIEPALKHLGSAFFKNISDAATIIKNDLTNPFENFIINSIENHGHLQTIISPATPIRLDEIYEPLTLVCHDNQIVVDKFPEILEKNNLLIVDTAGMGKSTLAKRILTYCAQEQKRIPLFIELRRISIERGIFPYITEQLNQYSEKRSFKLDYIEFLAQRGDFLFVLDGLDEVSDDHKEFVISSINSLTAIHKKSIFLLTSRSEPHLSAIKNFHHYSIKELTPPQSFSLIEKFDKYGKISKDLIVKLSEQLDTYSDFIKNPLITTLLFKAYEHKQKIPLMRHIFYRQVFDALFEGHDLTKDGFERFKKTNLNIDEFEAACRALGIACLQIQKIEFTRDEFSELIPKIQGAIPDKKITSSDLLHDLTNCVPLFCKDGNNYRWIHRSMQEYFAALAIHRDAKENSDNIIKRLIFSSPNEYHSNTIILFHDINAIKFRTGIGLSILNENIEIMRNEIEAITSSGDISTDDAIARTELTSINNLIILDRAYRFTSGEDVDNDLLDNIDNIFDIIRSLLPNANGFSNPNNTCNIVSAMDKSGNQPNILNNMHLLSQIKDFEHCLERNIREHGIATPINTEHIKSTVENNKNLDYNSKENFNKTTSVLRAVAIHRLNFTKMNELLSQLRDERDKHSQYSNIFASM